MPGDRFFIKFSEKMIWIYVGVQTPIQIEIYDRFNYDGRRRPRNTAVRFTVTEVSKMGRELSSTHTMSDAFMYLEDLRFTPEEKERFAEMCRKIGWEEELPVEYRGQSKLF